MSLEAQKALLKVYALPTKYSPHLVNQRAKGKPAHHPASQAAERLRLAFSSAYMLRLSCRALVALVSSIPSGSTIANPLCMPANPSQDPLLWQNAWQQG